MLKILIAMYDKTSDWANDELAKLYENGQLDKLYLAVYTLIQMEYVMMRIC